MRYLCIIPARSGSKRLPGKNIRLFAGLPLLVHTINLAKRIKSISNIIVSTDSEAIRGIAESYGASVPSLRPLALSGDLAISEDLCRYHLEEANRLGKEPHTIMLLQPTSPLRREHTVNSAISQFEKSKALALVSVCEIDKKIALESAVATHYTISAANNKLGIPENSLEKIYAPNGLIYIFSRAFLEKYRTVRDGAGLIHPLVNEDPDEVADIDTLKDFEAAQNLFTRTYLNDAH